MLEAVNTHRMSIELVERFAQCLLKDCSSKNDSAAVKDLGDYVMYFSNEIDMIKKRDQIFKDYVNSIECATEKPDSDSVLNEFNDEIGKTRMQLSKAKKCEKYVSFMKMISACRNDDNSNEEIQTISESVNKIDPISKLPIVEPVKNKKCGHTYEKSTILQLIKKNSRTRCPIAGCSAVGFVREDDLLPDNALKRMLSATDSNSQKKMKSS